MKLFAFAILLITPSFAFAFPEMVRHGYASCTACHVSPTGGGTLTNYGRALSIDVLSWRGTENEARWAYGATPLPAWWLGGGDVRVAQTYQRDHGTEKRRTILMQADLEGAVQAEKFTVDASVGVSEQQFLSRRHYVMYHVSEELSVRIGRFFPAFGIQTPEHIISTKRGLGWDERGESYNLEIAKIGDTWSFIATVIAGRPDDKKLQKEKGGSLLASYAFDQTFKVGASYYFGQNDFGRHHQFGPWAILGFTPRFYLLSELDGVVFYPSTGARTQSGFVDYQKLGYELVKGLHAYVAQEFQNKDLKSDAGRSDAYTVGLEFYPRPHLELVVAWQKYRMPAVDSNFQDFAWLMAHFYL